MINEMDDDELEEYVAEQSKEMGIHFDPDELDLGLGRRQALQDFIADNIHTEMEIVSALHSECQLTPHCNMFPNAEDEEELEEEMEHEL
jgi:hypothetical protein